MKLKIGVSGSAVELDKEVLGKARELGKEIAKSGSFVITGATTGISLEAAKGAREKKGFIIGVSPAENEREHKSLYGYPLEEFDSIVFTGLGISGRNVTFVRSCDVLVFVAGKIGTLNELTIALSEGKKIGVLTHTGGISDRIGEIIKLVGKKVDKVVFEEDPKKLIKELLGKK